MADSAASPAAESPAPAAASPAPSDSRDGMTHLASRYRSELESTVEGLRQRGAGLQDTAQKTLTDIHLDQQKDHIVAAFIDMAPVATPTVQVVQTLLWSAVLVFGLSMGVFLGSYLFAPIMGLLVGGFGAFAAAYIALPIAAYMHLAKETDPAAYKVAEHDSALRFKLLAFSVLEGVLVGFMIQTRYVSAAPVACFVPLIAAVAYHTVAEKVGNARAALLGASAGAPLAAVLLIAVLSGNLTFNYFLMSVLLCASLVVCLQFVFKQVSAQEQSTHIYQLAILLSSMYVKGLCFLLCGGAAEDFAN